jgi:N-acylneuraminate cytidylyltransferase
MITAVILARKGSKRLPGKNTMDFGGRPMVAWSIIEALKSSYVDEVLVSSDDDEVIDIAIDHGVIPIRRPGHLAQDDTPTYPALLHAIEYSDIVDDLTHVVLLQPTSPLRIAVDIDNCITTCLETGVPAVQSAELGGAVATGAVYVGEVEWLKGGGSWDDPDVPLVPWMPAERSVDIDTRLDFETALLHLKANHDNI